MADAKAKSGKPATKSAMYETLSEKTGLTKKQVDGFFNALTEYVQEQLTGKKAPGVVNIPNLLRIKKVVKPAQKERQGFKPGTREPMTFPAKPKRTVPKAYALKALKEMVTKG